MPLSEEQIDAIRRYAYEYRNTSSQQAEAACQTLIAYVEGLLSRTERQGREGGCAIPHLPFDPALEKALKDYASELFERAARLWTMEKPDGQA